MSHRKQHGAAKRERKRRRNQKIAQAYKKKKSSWEKWLKFRGVMFLDYYCTAFNLRRSRSSKEEFWKGGKLFKSTYAERKAAASLLEESHIYSILHNVFLFIKGET